MKQITSPEFRKSYPRLIEAVEVTALGRVIGTYWPVGYREVVTSADNAQAVMVATRTHTGHRDGNPGTAQKRRDAILSRVNRAG